MTYETITVALSQHEMEHLRRLAQKELRKPKDQATYLLRNVLLSESFDKNTSVVVRQDNHNTGAVVANP